MLVSSPHRATPQTRQALAEDGSSGQQLSMGLDIGNGATKLYCGLGNPLLESYVLYQPESAVHPGQGYVQYLEGDRTDLIGKQWIGGLNAYYSNPSAIHRVTGNREGKVELCLQLFLASLTHLAHRNEWDVVLVPSVHDGKTFGKGISQALSGSHRVRLAGRDSVVHVSVAKVLEEGAGVAFSIRGDYDLTSALIFDIGNGTAIVSAFNGLQMTFRDYSPESGVEALIEAIATHDSVRAFLKRPGDRHLIRSGIEKGDFSYGTQFPHWTFRDAYAACLPDWFNQSLKPFVKAAETRVPAATAIVAVGGGANLPGIAQLLAKKNISVPVQPRWCNARGLYEVALRVLNR